MTEDDNSVFEINDFTIVTPMEALSAAFESIIHSWDLVGRQKRYPNNFQYEIVSTRHSTIKFGENTFKIEHMIPQPINCTKEDYQTEFDALNSTGEDEDEGDTNKNLFSASYDVENIKNGFENKGICTTEFGVREFIYISPFDEINDKIASESQCATIIGALKASIHSVRCEIPVLVTVKDQDVQMYCGYASDGSVSFEFTSASLRYFNRRHTHLSGITSIFKERSQFDAKYDDIRIATRFHHYFPMSHVSWERLTHGKYLTKLPFGPRATLPFEGINIVANWKSFREDVLVENESHNDFNINYAAYWNVHLILVEPPYLKGMLDEMLATYTNKIKLHLTSNSVKDALGRYYYVNNAANALDKISFRDASDVKIGSSTDMETPPNGSMIVGPLPPDLISAWITSIFNEGEEKLEEEMKIYNDRHVNQNIIPRGDNFYTHVIDLEELIFNSGSEVDDNSYQFKAATRDSITWKIAIAMSRVLSINDVNKRAEPQLWLEFVRCLRDKYENNQDINTSDPDIDLSQCFIAQKIQLLQCCVVARRKRMELLSNANDLNNDEFFDANSDLESEDGDNITNDEGKGRLKVLENATLLNDKKKPIYIPITQDRSPMTEDMLKKHTEYICGLSDADRVSAQLDPLRSDMQSFKAANPGCVLQDFLRWHSPKDVDEETGEMSERMTIANNTWQKCWDEALPIAVVNQTRLFNDTMLAEEVLEMMENATIGTVREWLKPIVFTASFEYLLSMLKDPTILYEQGLVEAKEYASILRQATENENHELYGRVAAWMTRMETRINLMLSVTYEFNKSLESIEPPYPTQEEIRKTVEQLVDNSLQQVYGDPDSDFQEVVDGFVVKPQDSIGRAISNICDFDVNSDDVMKNPKRKEYILVMTRSENNSNLVARPPQRMYASMENEFHQLCSTMGTDCNFFIDEYSLN